MFVRLFYVVGLSLIILILKKSKDKQPKKKGKKHNSKGTIYHKSKTAQNSELKRKTKILVICWEKGGGGGEQFKD